MDKPPKELAFSLRYYFVWVFVAFLFFLFDRNFISSLTELLYPEQP